MADSATIDTKTNRRNAMILAATGAASIGLFNATLEAHDESPEQETICFVVRCSDYLGSSEQKQAQDYFRRAFAHTKWADTPVIILPPGVEFEVALKPEQPCQP